MSEKVTYETIREEATKFANECVKDFCETNDLRESAKALLVAYLERAYIRGANLGVQACKV